jgi:hypothetical protein
MADEARPDVQTRRDAPWVVLDSTVLGGNDRYLESAAGSLLRDEATAGRLRIAVPEVVLIESEANHRRDVEAAESRLVAARAALERLRVRQGHDLKPRKLRYREDLEEILRQAGAEVLPIPDVPHERLIAKAVNRRRPFNEKGTGYRDALVWDSLLGLLDRTGSQVILISRDHAFSEDGKTPELARDLAAELRERDHSGRVELYFELGDFTAQLPRAHELVTTWERWFRGDRSRAQALRDHLLEVANHDATTVISATNLPANARNARFLSFSNPRYFQVHEVWIASDDTTILNADLTVDYRQEFEALLPDPTAPAGIRTWTPMTADSSIVLTFEVIQHPDGEFAGRLVSWSDPRDSR